ncbi:MAG: aldehyde dehydrogenase family protein [Streptosporangiaceae bacterium]|nr:aldehyde dehydrogenase family protein [Streptosporangiaceae bacterium]
MLETVNPATGEVLAVFPERGRREVDAAVAAAREAAAWWEGLGWSGRRIRLLAWKSHLVRYMERLAQLVHAETGKPLDDAKLEIILAALRIDWAARNARRVLRPRRMPSGLITIHLACSVEYHPLGVVGVIGPWNYPVSTPVGSIGYALAAGNAVVFKPSELTPATGEWLARSFREALAVFGQPMPVLQAVTGGAATGDALVRSGVDKISFTGSADTARKVLTAAAGNLTPVIAECGGKDAMLVAADADLDAAADAAAWGAMTNAGQACVGIERVYVANTVYHSFLEKLTQRVADLRPGSDSQARYGPMTAPEQAEIVAKHVADALARGGRAAAGGTDAVTPPYIRPVVLADVPEDSAAVSEETFGPTVTVTPVASLAQAVALANRSRYGLGSAVFARDRSAAMTAARSLRTGMTSINSVLGFALVPSLPFGGVAESGFGRVHGRDGLREFSTPKAITRQRMRPLLNLFSFGRTPRDMRRIVTLVTLLHGRLHRPRSTGRRRGAHGGRRG